MKLLTDCNFIQLKSCTLGMSCQFQWSASGFFAVATAKIAVYFFFFPKHILTVATAVSIAKVLLTLTRRLWHDSRRYRFLQRLSPLGRFHGVALWWCCPLKCFFEFITNNKAECARIGSARTQLPLRHCRFCNEPQALLRTRFGDVSSVNAHIHTSHFDLVKQNSVVWHVLHCQSLLAIGVEINAQPALW